PSFSARWTISVNVTCPGASSGPKGVARCFGGVSFRGIVSSELGGDADEELEGFGEFLGLGGGGAGGRGGKPRPDRDGAGGGGGGVCVISVISY
ncbi:MAG: hypothetical protein O4965_26460, partial [Trichodesmium sp. St19_bin1]|nr:hypothetical protein [Trichodesmium sp. St19_bin1]